MKPSYKIIFTVQFFNLQCSNSFRNSNSINETQMLHISCNNIKYYGHCKKVYKYYYFVYNVGRKIDIAFIRTFLALRI